MTVTDFMPPRSTEPDLVRIVEGKKGRVAMHLELVIRFDYGSIVPWVRRTAEGVRVGGPDTLRLQTEVPLRGENLTTAADFTVSPGERVPFVLRWHPSHEPAPAHVDPEETLQHTERWWRAWSDRCTYEGPWRESVLRSLITLKAAHLSAHGRNCGGRHDLPAGATRRRPKLGLSLLLAPRRDLHALCLDQRRVHGRSPRMAEWLLRAVAGTPAQMHIMYGLAGERRLTELKLDWLPGYEGSRPVRIGNAAYQQFQLDVFGEVMDALHLARRAGLPPEENAWRVQQTMMEHLESVWQQPDEGIWEVRGPKRHFTHSKVMAWTAADRVVKTVENQGLQGPVDRWRTLRAEIHDEVCRRGYDPKRNTFVQSYGREELDASLLMIPLVGFLPPSDSRVVGTVEAIQRELMPDGFVFRYPTDPEVDGLPSGEGVFLPCSFWLADCLALLGRRDEANRLFERLLDLRNDVGLLSEEYDPQTKRLVGNFPQAFSHVGLINTACNLSKAAGPATDRQLSQGQMPKG